MKDHKEQIASGKVLFNFEERPMTRRDRGGTTVVHKDDDGDVYCTFRVRGRAGRT